VPVKGIVKTDPFLIPSVFFKEVDMLEGLIFLLVVSIPALVIQGNHDREAHQEWIVMEDKLSDPDLEKYHHKVIEVWEVEYKGQITTSQVTESR